MKNNAGFVLLALLVVALAVALIANRYREAERQKSDSATILDFSNQITKASLQVDDLNQVNLALRGNLATNQAALAVLSNNLTSVSQTVTNLGNSLAAAQSQISSQTARIADLQQQNKELNDRASSLATEAVELTNRINSLTAQIENTRHELALSKTNNAYLDTQLQQLLATRAEYEQKFETLTVLRDQIKKLEENEVTERRLKWMKQGTFQQEKGAQLMVDYRNGVRHTDAGENYGLHVELGTDGSVRSSPLNPAATNGPATNAPAR